MDFRNTFDARLRRQTSERRAARLSAGTTAFLYDSTYWGASAYVAISAFDRWNTFGLGGKRNEPIEVSSLAVAERLAVLFTANRLSEFRHDLRQRDMADAMRRAIRRRDQARGKAKKAKAKAGALLAQANTAHSKAEAAALLTLACSASRSAWVYLDSAMNDEFYAHNIRQHLNPTSFVV